MKTHCRPIPSFRIAVLVAAFVGLSFSTSFAAGKGFEIKKTKSGLTVNLDGKLFTRYVLDQGNKPFLYPVIGPTGKSMTRHYPMKKVEGEQHDHPHHRSIWFGHQGIGGFDTWHEPMTGEERYRNKKKADLEKFLKGLGPTVHREFKKLHADADKAVIVSVNDYVGSDGSKLLSDERTITFTAGKDARTIDFDITLIANHGDVELDDKKDAGFSVRVPTSMSITGKQGGRILNSRGDKDGDAWGKRAEWVSYWGPVEGETLGVTILNHPGSFRHPTPWHARTYGLFTANPFGTKSLDKNAESGAFTLKKGKKITLRHRVILHKGDAQAADIEGEWKKYAAATGKTQARKKGGKAKKPNILFIAIDDQNDWLGYLGGHPQAYTPNIDKLARRGTAFLNAHCQSPLCNPSRTSLMFSRRPDSTGIYGLAPWIRNVDEFKDLVSLPQYLQKHGYRTYSTGKIYHGGYGRKKTDKEFQEIGPGATGKPFPPNGKLVETPFGNHRLVDWGTFPHKDEDKGDYICASWAAEKLKDMPEDEPFFMSCGFFLPHVPLFATQKWFDLYPEDELMVPRILRDDRKDTPRSSWYLHWYLPEVRLKWLEEVGEWKNIVRSYLACVSFMDSQFGRVLDALEESGHADDTIVVVWGDHGWHLGEKEITGKNTLWDDGTRVPLIFAGPGVKAGQRCTKPAELLDIYPTLIELTGLPKKGDLHGHSLIPQLRDANAERQWPAITTHNANNHGIRSENWRYIRYGDGAEELYDMKNDPNEWTNLAGDPKYAKVIAEHKKFLPQDNRPPAPNSRSRILIYKDKGVINWEGKDVQPGDPIPGL